MTINLVTSKAKNPSKWLILRDFWTFCALVGIRTPNLLIRSQVLYPIELRMLSLCAFPVVGSAKVARGNSFVKLFSRKICLPFHQEGTNSFHSV